MPTWIMSPVRYFFSFFGRANRKTYWTVYLGALGSILLILLLENIVIRYVYPELTERHRSVFDVLLLALQVCVWVLLIAPFSAVVRRLHDLNLRGWWILVAIAVITVIDLIEVFSGWPIATSTNIQNIIAGIALIVLGLIPGKTITNRFGPPSPIQQS